MPHFLAWYNLHMLRTFRTPLLSLFVIILLLTPSFGLAALPQQIVPKTCDGPNCSICDLATLAQNILNTAIFIAVFAAAVLFAWAGWKYLTAGGDSSKVSSARGIFFNVMIGLVIIIAAWLIVDTLMHTLTGTSFGQSWGKLC